MGFIGWEALRMKRFAPTAADDARKAEGVRAQARVPVPLKANPRTEIAPIADSARVRP